MPPKQLQSVKPISHQHHGIPVHNSNNISNIMAKLAYWTPLPTYHAWETLPACVWRDLQLLYQCLTVSSGTIIIIRFVSMPEWYCLAFEINIAYISWCVHVDCLVDFCVHIAHISWCVHVDCLIDFCVHIDALELHNRSCRVLAREVELTQAAEFHWPPCPQEIIRWK